MKSFARAFAVLIASSAPAFAQDVYEAWDEEPESYVVERRVTVETFVRPAYRAPERHIYAARPAYAYEYAHDDIRMATCGRVLATSPYPTTTTANAR